MFKEIVETAILGKENGNTNRRMEMKIFLAIVIACSLTLGGMVAKQVHQDFTNFVTKLEVIQK